MNAQTTNKIALITGANKGLGKAIARELGKQNITVLIGARNAERGEEAVNKLRFEDIDAHFIKLDVSDNTSIESAYNAIAEQFGRLDILVNNAGVNLEFSTGLPAPSQVSEVRLQVKAIALNRAEVVFRQGAYLEQPKLPARIGYEASGIIDAVGAGVEGIKVGDKVSTIPSPFAKMSQYGVYGESAIVPAEVVTSFPDNLSFEQGTAIWMQYLTAYGALNYYGQMEEGDYVIITAASSSVGYSAIQLAKATGAVAIATTRTSKKKQKLLDAGADYVIATQEEDLVAKVMEITSGHGADLIFDPIAGSIVNDLANAAARSATIFIYGALSMEVDSTPFPLMTALSKGLKMQAYTVLEITGNPERLESAKQYIYDGLQSGKLDPVIDPQSFNLDNIVEAHRYMESNQQNGKIIVTV